jgi:hypothetical protein
MKKNEIIKIIKDALLNVSKKMINHKGIDHVIKSKLQFEKWFQVELLSEFIILNKKNPRLNIKIEYPVSIKESKKGKTIDLVILNNEEKFIAIELKIIPTNYDITGFKKTTKGITNKIDEMIQDLEKSKNDGYIYSFSIGLIFPFQSDANHRNNTKDFNKQLRKLEAAGKVIVLDTEISKSFISRYYILHS